MGELTVESVMVENGAFLLWRERGNERHMERDVHGFFTVRQTHAFAKAGRRARIIYNGGNEHIACYCLVHGEAKAREKYSWDK